MKNPQVIWNNILRYLEGKIEPQHFQTWFAPITPHTYTNNTLTVQIPNQIFYEWIEGHYLTPLRQAVHQELGAEGKLAYQVLATTSATVTSSNSPTSSSPYTGLPLHPLYTFENFIVGDCNDLAQAATRAVAENPGKTSFNPLLIYAGVGLGKTHLLQALAHSVKERHPQKRTIYVSAEEFTAQFIRHLRENRAQEFVNLHLNTDLLLIDDVQFLAKKEKTQEIFFHIFNHLHQHEKQVVLTSDTAPSDLQGFEKRLVSRFKWGLTTDLKEPELEAKIAIIESKLGQDNLKLPQDVVHYIAQRVLTNVRELEGVVKSLKARIILHKEPITIVLVDQVLSKVIGASEPEEINIRCLQKVVLDYCNKAFGSKVTLDDLKSRRRTSEVVLPRHITMYLAKKYMKQQSLQTIGKPFGRKDHSTVSYAIQAIKDLLETDKSFKGHMKKLEAQIRSRYPIPSP